MTACIVRVLEMGLYYGPVCTGLKTKCPSQFGESHPQLRRREREKAGKERKKDRSERIKEKERKKRNNMSM